MANWYYYNENGDKIGPIPPTTLKELARQGLVTRETKIENGNGRTALAGSVSGLTFAETTQEPMGGFNFPDLTSTGQMPSNYDPFANVAPVQAPSAPSKVHSTLTQPIVLALICGCGGMVLMLLIVLAFTLMTGNKKETSQANRQNQSQENNHNQLQENRQNQAQEIHQNQAQENRQNKAANNAQSQQVLLKEPPEKSAFMQATKQKTEQFIKEELRPAAYGDHLIAPYILVMETSWEATNIVYVTLTNVQNEKELLSRIAALQNSYAICMTNIATQWNSGIRSKLFVFNADIAINQVTAIYAANSCYHNLEQMMATVTARIKTLDKEKYVNTIKLYSILSKYKKSITTPSGSLDTYYKNIADYQEEFTQAMSLAELEW
jgi:hypothetical protein